MISNENILENVILMLETLFDIKSSITDEDIIFEEENFKLKIRKNEINEVIKKITHLDYHDTFIINDNYLEELLDIQGHNYYKLKFFVESKSFFDENNLIKYELSKPSLEYVLMSFFNLFKSEIGNCPSLFLKNYYDGIEFSNSYCSGYILGTYNNFKIRKELTQFFDTIGLPPLDMKLKNFMDAQFNEIRTLKVISRENNLSKVDFFNLANSFRFWINYNTQSAFINKFEYSINSLESIKRIEDIKDISNIPKKIYIEELLLYYHQALSSKDLVLRYISFYHIIEFFFDLELSKIKEKIKLSPSESYEKNIDSFRNIINKLQLKEEFQLKMVLVNFLDITKLKEDLNQNNTNYFEYLKKNGVRFADAKPIKEDSLLESIAVRIYKVRNALVHRKEGDKRFKYKISSKNDESVLNKEMKLIQLIAEQIIISSSEN